MTSTRSLLLISRCPPYPLHLGDRLIIGHLIPLLAQQGVAIDLIALAEAASPAALRQESAHMARCAAFVRSMRLLPASPRRPLHYLRRLLLPCQRVPTAARQAWQPALFAAVEECLARQPYDAIWVFGGVQVYEVAGALGGRAAVITPYESYALYLQRALRQSPTLTTRLRRWVAWQYERFMFARYARVVVLAAPDAQALRAADPTLDVRVIPNGVGLPVEASHAREEAALLFVGNYEYAPNVDAAIYLVTRVLPAVAEKYRQAKVWLVGNAPPPALRDLASDRVTVTGYVDDLAPWYQRASVFVAPLMVGAGLKNKVLEALAHRLPVVATPLSVDGIAVRHEESALIGDVDALAGLVLRALDDDALRLRLARAGRRIVEEQYSWASIADAYLALFSEVRDA